MRFIDEARIDVKAGHGGRGASSFRREKYVPRGGPDGGDGGRGGDVVLVADPNRATLLDQRYRRKYAAKNGASGAPANRTGADGAGLEIPVPVGTIVRDAADGAVLVDLTVPGERVVVAAGGIGGRGNARFATPTRQAPTHSEGGRAGEERTLLLELKLLADVGIVGLPNAGKSTLIRRISASRARVADYPFTTLAPNLGVVQAGDRSFVVADVPGLIEGAAAGAGLGHQFLRHVERTRLLVHLVAADQDDVRAAYDTILRELAAYSPEVAAKPTIVVLNKIDLLPDAAGVAELTARLPGEVLAISGVSGAGIDGLRREIARRVFEIAPPPAPPPEPTL